MASRSICVCGHAADLHEHYRSGADCAECGPVLCAKYRKTRSFGHPQPAPTTAVSATTEATPLADVRLQNLA
jgi:hypothetical protein